MAAAIKALNAKIRSNPVSDYFCSTHFWGPASNFGIPIAAVMDTQKDPDIISGRMTLALTGYAAVFMRYALAVTPKNYLLFACHFVNFGAQSTQGYRFVNYWYMGGREASLGEQAKAGADGVTAGAQKMLDQAKDGAKDAKDKVQGKVDEAVGKVKGS